MEPRAGSGSVPVWVCREERRVSGLTRRTTCGDVVRVLLEDQTLREAGVLSGPPQSYCVVEKWRGFERVLPSRTRILRLWAAWGAERDSVRFLLLRNDASLPGTGPRSAEARVVPSRDGGGPGALLKGSGRSSRTAAAASLTRDRQRRVVRKAFRKLDRMNRQKERSADREPDSVDRMETLVHLVVSQDHTIRQQGHRIRELDREIERYEAGLHCDRVRRLGANYVQDLYLLEPRSPEEPRSGDRRDAPGPRSPEENRYPDRRDARRATERLDADLQGARDQRDADREDARRAADALAQFQEHARRCEEVALLQEELTEREALAERITGEIRDELNRRWMKRRRAEREEDARRDVEDAPGAAERDEERQRVRTQLDASLYVGLRLQTELDAVRGDLDRSLALWETRERELLDLLELLARAEAGGPGGGRAEAGGPGGGRAEAGGPGGGPAEAEGPGGGPAEAGSSSDSDSDTGLSSMDSDNPPVCESLV
ncbi:ras association domain-containing protein 10-like [Salarias fasciatus]|uniref:ras association domain-containing protein 10-like n=1 Tax=Salarias fasciatus TaxID=181472 RepID=UPI001176D25A|nr:ras association domain-containing protein 10-like [Salarias fasciatus]